MYIGRIFCHVDRMMQMFQFMAAITWGNQKWQGAIPALAIRPHIINRVPIFDSWSVGINSVTPPTRSIIDPTAWARKYLIAPWASWLFLPLSIIGMKAIMLSSKATHSLSQFDAESPKIVLIISVAAKIKFVGAIGGMKMGLLL